MGRTYVITRKAGHFLARLSFLITTQIYPRAEEKPRTNSPKSPGNTNKDGEESEGKREYPSMEVLFLHPRPFPLLFFSVGALEDWIDVHIGQFGPGGKPDSLLI